MGGPGSGRRKGGGSGGAKKSGKARKKLTLDEKIKRNSNKQMALMYKRMKSEGLKTSSFGGRPDTPRNNWGRG
jgi:hypothetical protein